MGTNRSLRSLTSTARGEAIAGDQRQETASLRCAKHGVPLEGRTVVIVANQRVRLGAKCPICVAYLAAKVSMLKIQGRKNRRIHNRVQRTSPTVMMPRD